MNSTAASLRDRVRDMILRIRGRHHTPHYVISFYFNTIGVLSRANYPRLRWLSRWKSPLKLHLGCGPIYIPDWVNIDGLLVWKTDAFWDVRAGLPFANDSVDGIYTSHMLEHFEIDQVQQILREIHRVLKPGAGFRIVVPNLENAIDAYIAHRAGQEVDGQRVFTPWDKPCPTRHGEFRSRGALFNWETLCDNQHPVMFDFSFLSELLSACGTWTDVQRAGPGQSQIMTKDELEAAESTRAHIVGASLVVEGRKTVAAATQGT